MQIYAPDEVPLDKASEAEVYVNVFNGSQRSKVELRIGEGQWHPMKQAAEADPGYKRIHALEKSLKDKPWRELTAPKTSTHLWKAPLPEGLNSGTHLLEIRATDLHGRTYQSHRVIRVRAAQPTASEASK